MFTRVAQFLDTWRYESAQTALVLAQLTDESLRCRVAPGYRTIGDIAWHIATALHEIVGKTGLSFRAPTKTQAPPTTAAAIREAYVAAVESLAAALAQDWDDRSLTELDQIYGQSWAKGHTLMVLLHHEIHHRGQLTVLLRQTGLRVPGVYGPTRDDK